MSVTVVLPQNDDTTETPIPYTGNPWVLCWLDLLLIGKNIWSVAGILHPWNQWLCKELDELYPSIPNLICLGLHGILIVLQLLFLVSLPFLLVLPVWTAIIYVSMVMALTLGVSRVLNCPENFLESKVDLGSESTVYENECWLFLNGVSVGRHWLQGNLERLALTFRRPITGFPNRTYGIVFDLIQCMIERNFCFATLDIRNSYDLIKQCLMKEKHTKVVLILHSQGGIEGGLILDWLLSELSHDVLQKLEIYTFGCAANHFNNPHSSSTASKESQMPESKGRRARAVRHIEHYADDGDFVARWGILSFNRAKNRYMGRVFIRSGMGHLLNQHYLNAMFPLDKNKRVEEKNRFMDCEVSFTSDGAADLAKDGVFDAIWNGGYGQGEAIVEDTQSPVEPVSIARAESVLAARLSDRKPTVKDFSRLWEYRNGGSPKH